MTSIRCALAGLTSMPVKQKRTGCGLRWRTALRALAPRATVTGIDMGEAPLAVLRLPLESGVEVDYVQSTAEAWRPGKPPSGGHLLEMLEHPALTVITCADLYPAGGDLFFSTINRPKSFLFAIVGAEYILNLLPAAPTNRQIDQAIRTRALDPRGRIHAGNDGHDLQPADQALPATPNDVSVNYLIRAKAVTSPVSAVLFDLDGTLIDTAPEFIHIGLQVALKPDSPIDAKTIWHSVSTGPSAWWRLPRDARRRPGLRAVAATISDALRNRPERSQPPYPGLPELVAGRQARIAWGVVTNKLARFALR